MISEEMTMVLKADKDTAKAGTVDNLIVDVFFTPQKNPQGNPKRPQDRVYIGSLPAIPFEIVP
jgi:hypothetical protein